VDALKPQSDVVIGGGVKIGHVSEIVIKDDRVLLEVMVKDHVKIPANAKFRILSKGLMGDKYVNVVAQADSGEYLQPGDHIQGVEPTNIDKAFQRFGQVADSIKQKTSFSNMLKNFGSLSHRVDRLVKKNEKNIDQGLQNFSRSARSLRKFSVAIEGIGPNLKQMFSEGNSEDFETTLQNLKTLSVRLDAQVAKMEKGEGTLGALIHDQKMARDLKDLINDLKKHPWKLLWKR
jgi:phospholipid/cholesterol/gamma-HCH transport system substrate-binding protein